VNQSHTAATLARLQAVDWTGGSGFKHHRSRVRLMAEYLRRTALWAQALDATSEWPFFDIAAHVDPSIQVPENQAKELEALIYNHIGWPSVDRLARAALHWAALKDAGVPTAPGLPDPYEPILLMFDRGGAWTTEAGFIDVNGAAVRRQSWQDHLAPEPITALDSVTLNALDEKAAN
jgi:hypothetical protein